MRGILHFMETSTTSETELTEFQRETIDYFVSFVQMFGLPKSIGQIYGLLFATTSPLTMDDIVGELKISKGSASQGLSLLKNLGAVKSQDIEGERREHFRADLNVARIVNHFFEHRLGPRLENGEQRLQRMRRLVEAEKVDSNGSAENSEMLSRIQALQKWQNRGKRVFPMLKAWLKKW